MFQELLQTLRTIADKYHVDIAEVACQYVLQKPMVAATIVGARNSKHLNSLKKLESFSLDDNDLKEIAKITNQSKGPNGPFYQLERDKTGKHGAIMKYNLNEA